MDKYEKAKQELCEELDLGVYLPSPNEFDRGTGGKTMNEEEKQKRMQKVADISISWNNDLSFLSWEEKQEIIEYIKGVIQKNNLILIEVSSRTWGETLELGRYR